MTYTLELPETLRRQGWKVKLRNLERNEPPHVTIMRRTESWRYGLRELGFMDSSPDSREVPEAVIAEIVKRLDVLRAEWNSRYPENPIRSEDENDEDEG